MMPTKIAFRIFNARKEQIAKWRPASMNATRMAFVASGRGGKAAAYIQWLDELTGYESQLYAIIDEREFYTAEIQEYRDKVNPLKGGKPRLYRRGLSKADFAMRTHATASEEEAWAYIPERDHVTTEGNNDIQAYTDEELEAMQAELDGE